jgi:hypothetical protein
MRIAIAEAAMIAVNTLNVLSPVNFFLSLLNGTRDLLIRSYLPILYCKNIKKILG